MSRSRSLVQGFVLLWVWFLIAPAWPAPPTPAPPSAEQSDCVPSKFRIALDIGHYRAAPGATSATGVVEYDYNLALAQRMLAVLRTAGFTAVTLIGEAGTPLRLEGRTQTAQAAGAALFVSFHHDSVQPRYLSTWIVDGKSERYSDVFHGYSLFVSDSNRRPTESKAFARLLGEALLGEGLTPSLHHAEPIPGEGRQLLDPRLGLYRFDGLAVLRTAMMPAVLLESAIIVNRAEELRVRSGEYHKKVVAAVVKAVSSYCAGHPPSLPGQH
jgi:N-acetylmuramoyl-L-alanine amidase